MIVVPAPFSRYQKPCTYRKKIYKETEIVGAECEVRVVVTFPSVFEPIKKISISDERPTIVWGKRWCPETKYGFIVKVNLDKREYEINKRNLKEYACDKAKEQSDYQERLKECLSKEFCSEDYKEYAVETYILDTIKLKTIENEIEEYVPVIYE